MRHDVTKLTLSLREQVIKFGYLIPENGFNLNSIQARLFLPVKCPRGSLGFFKLAD